MCWKPQENFDDIFKGVSCEMNVQLKVTLTKEYLSTTRRFVLFRQTWYTLTLVLTSLQQLPFHKRMMYSRLVTSDVFTAFTLKCQYGLKLQKNLPLPQFRSWVQTSFKNTVFAVFFLLFSNNTSDEFNGSKHEVLNLSKKKSNAWNRCKPVYTAERNNNVNRFFQESLQTNH